MNLPPYTTADFLQDAQRQLVNTAIAALSDSKLSWSQVAPFLDTARAVCRDDLRLNGLVAVHGLEYQGGDLVPADEAYLSVSARDREDQVEWLSQTYWLSDLVLADQDPARVRDAVAAIERTLDKLRGWLAEAERENALGDEESEL